MTSIKDIARAAGVSHSTVSRALGDSDLVRVETKARIRHLAHEMGYSPDAAARSLVLGRSLTLGVVVTTIADPFIAEVVQAIEMTAYRHGYSVILASSTNEPDRELAAVEMLRSKRVDGVIVTSSRVGALYGNHLERIGAPVVLVNSHSDQAGRYTYAVSVDNRHGGRLGTEHLIKLGHRRIAYISGQESHSDDLERLAGYRDALLLAGIAFDAGLVLPGTGETDAGARALAALRRHGDPITAVFCYNDRTAMGLLGAARRAGVAVPGDLSVVGFDDIPYAAYLAPALTTVAQPHQELGQAAVEMTLKLMESGGAESERSTLSSLLPGKLIVRDSTGRPRVG